MITFNPIRFLFGFSILCALSTANAYDRCCNTCPGLYFAIEPFYAKATDTLLTNSIIAVKIPDPAILGDFKEEYHLGLEGSWNGSIVLGYDFPSYCNRNYGLFLEYTFFNHSNSATISNDARNSAGLPVLASAEFIDITDESSARFSLAESDLSQKYNTLDLLASSNINPCNNLLFKIFAGARYFHLKENLHHHYQFIGDITGLPVQNIYDVNFKNETDTLGPRIGTRFVYHLIHGFGFSGEIATSLLYGVSDSKFYNAYHLTPTSPLGNETQLTSSNRHRDSAHIVPAISGEVSLFYKIYFCNCTSAAVEAGYRGDKYFNAADDTAYQQLLAGDDVNSNSNYHNFDLSGPFLRLSFHL